MSVPEFLEAQHPLVRSLSQESDRQLVRDFQQNPAEGKYFTAIFCRYGGLTYVLIRNMARAALQTDYLFARVWRNIFFELTHLEVGEAEGAIADEFSLQTWIFNKAALCVNQEEAPSIESVQYALNAASPPLWCYLQTALDRLPALHRLVLVLAQTFHWSEPRILGFLEAEGQTTSREALAQIQSEAYRRLIEAIPEDIQIIYFDAPLLQAPETAEAPTFG
ncbi:sigma-70 family RNA polymerase sigma factor [Altericista sp. CCNU0014]|uniref:sigma-70 family RNA polymerase sigma factor n=1 Tax=Altericista sp. CCNU0014 TaxID=3082949 RepID=UPI00384F1BCC